MKRKPPHYALKCDQCAICVREGDEERRRGCVQMTFWTPAGPLALFLCGRCAEKVRHDCCDKAAVEERVRDSGYLTDDPRSRRTTAHNAIIDFMRGKRRTLDLMMELMRKAD